MSPATTTYARARLLLGMSGVGLLTVFATAALVVGLPGRVLPTTTLPPLQESAWVLGVFGLYVVLQAPFDLLGGWILPGRHGRRGDDGAAHLRRWIRGVLSQGGVFLASCLVMLETTRLAGETAAWLSASVLMVVLIALQAPLARVTGSFGRASKADEALRARVCSTVGRPVRVRFWEASDVGFTGGWFGLPGIETLVLPSRWRSDLAPDALDAAVLRRAGALATGARTRGLVVALLFNATGLGLASRLPSAGLESLAQLGTTACGMVLWSFLGLLVLPSASRPAVLAADAFARRHGAGSGALARAIASLDRWQDDEPKRSPLVETLFHPVPSVERRLAALDQGEPAQGGAWHAARMALYLSWATLGLLPRAVHCNSGRPQLWAALPAD